MFFKSFFQAWQFLIKAEGSKPLSEAVRSRLATLNLGACDETWHMLGFRPLSHPDPVIRVRTAGRAGSTNRLQKASSKTQVLQRYMENNPGVSISADGDVQTSLEVPQIQESGDAAEVNEEAEVIDPEAADVTVMLGLPDNQKICLISQLVDISGEEEEVRCCNFTVQFQPQQKPLRKK